MSNAKTNVKQAIIYASGGNFLAGIVFLIFYAKSGNIWVLIAGILMILAGVGFIFLAQRFMKKINEIEKANPVE